MLISSIALPHVEVWRGERIGRRGHSRRMKAEFLGRFAFADALHLPVVDRTERIEIDEFDLSRAIAQRLRCGERGIEDIRRNCEGSDRAHAQSGSYLNCEFHDARPPREWEL